MNIVARYGLALWVLGVGVLAMVLWWVVLVGGSSHGVLSVSFLDIGQGDSILITSPTGVQMLIDGGRDGRVLRQLGKHMSFFDRDIDIVFATHPDADHIGGLVSVLSISGGYTCASRGAC